MERPKQPNSYNVDGFYPTYVFDLNRYIDWLEQQAAIQSLKAKRDLKPHIKRIISFCGCIDRCSSKRNEFYCTAGRKCVHKIKP